MFYSLLLSLCYLMIKISSIINAQSISNHDLDYFEQTVLNEIELVNDTNNVNEELKKENSKSMYWKVTENGLTYCPIHCILTTEKFFKKYQDILKNHLINHEAIQETTALVLNITGSILSPNENIFKATHIETTGTQASNSNSKTQSAPSTAATTTTSATTEQPPLTSLVDTKSKYEMRSVIECIPYLDQTKVDEFPSIKERFTLPNKAEPELIKIFQKTKNTAHSTIEEIKKNLIRIKREKPYLASTYVKIANYFRIIGNSFQACECFRKAIFLEPLNNEVFLHAANFLYHIDKYKEAFEMIRESIDILKPAKVPLEHHQSLAKILAAYGDTDDTFHNLEYSMNIGADDPDILFDEIEKRAALRNKIEESDTNLIFRGFVVIVFLFLIVKFVKTYRKQEKEAEESMMNDEILNDFKSLENLRCNFEAFETPFISNNNKNTRSNSSSSSDLDLCVKIDKRKNASSIFVFNSSKNSKPKRM